MKRTMMISFVFLFAFLGITLHSFADTVIGLRINGVTVSPEIPLETKNGITVGPIRQISEALGANVAWDEENQTVAITDKLSILQNQIRLLETAIDRSNPEIVVEQWAKAKMSRNGALEYALLSDAQRNESLPDYEGFRFFMGGSSPWVDSYVITKKDTQPDGSILFDVELCWTTSTREKSYRIVTVAVERDTRDIGIYTHRDEDAKRWCISSIHYGDRVGHAPGICVTAGDTEISYTVGKTIWKGEVYDRGAGFQDIIKDSKEEAIPYIALGSEIQIQFYDTVPGSAVPDSIELYDYILTKDGTVKYDEKVANGIALEFAENTGYFILESNPAALLSSNSTDYESGTILRGFRLIGSWGDNQCEYTFILRSDAH